MLYGIGVFSTSFSVGCWCALIHCLRQLLRLLTAIHLPCIKGDVRDLCIEALKSEDHKESMVSPGGCLIVVMASRNSHILLAHAKLC